ncbi:MAG: beta-propeller fold lactonase family protein [Terracidiphilus sp.]
MKYNKSSQLALISVASLLAATLVSACSQLTETLTVDFVYVASSKAAGPNNDGEINVFEINSESGRMRQIPSSPFPSEGRDPVSETVSADYGSLFVTNQDDNTIVQFVIGTDGKLYPFNTVNTPGIFPLAITANKANLFVVDTYQPLPICSTAEPCSGSIGVYPLSAATSSAPAAIGPPAANTAVSGNYWPLGLPGQPDVIEPTGIDVLKSGAYVYVATYDSTADANYIFGFSIGSGGALTPLNGGAPLGGGAFATGTCTGAFLNAPYVVGTCTAAIASDPTSSYVYVTDEINGEVHGFSIASNTGLLTPLSGSPFSAGNQPSAIVVDPSYPYVYVANSLDATVTAFSASGGALTSLGTYTTGEQPVAIGIDPSTSHFVFTANFLGNNVSGFELSTTAGTLLDSQYSPFQSDDWPTAVAAIPHNGTGAGVQP